jgi:hypothetical protein
VQLVQQYMYIVGEIWNPWINLYINQYVLQHHLTIEINCNDANKIKNNLEFENIGFKKNKK